MAAPTQPTSPRSAAERRVLEQLHQSVPTQRRTLPRPAATSPITVDALPARERRPRSRLFGASATQPLPTDSRQLLLEILDEFPEIDATTVSVLLEMHNNEREPVVQRLEEVYRRPGRAPQKRHSFPSSSPRELGRRRHTLLPTLSSRARRARPFSVDRVDEDDDDDGIGDEEGSNDDNITDEGRRSADHSRRSRTSHGSSNTPPETPLVRTARSLTGTSSRRRHRSGSNAGSTGSRHRKRSFRRARDTEGSGSERAPARLEERAADPLLAPWGQEASPRPRGDAVPPVMLAPHALRARQAPRGGGGPFANLSAPLASAVVAEPAAVRFRARPSTPGSALRAEDVSVLPGDDVSVTSSGTASSVTRESPLFSSAVSSAMSSVRSNERAGPAAAAPVAESALRDGRDNSTRATAAAVMRNFTSSGRQSRNSNASEGSGGPLSRRRRASRSVRELGHAMRDRARQYRDNWSEGDDDIDEIRRTAGSVGGDHEFSSVDGNDGSDDGAVRSTQEMLIVDAEEALAGVMEDGAGFVHVDKTLLQKLIQKVNTAERTLHKLQTERSQKVAQLVAAVNDVSSSMVNYDMRQQRRFEHLSERFTGNNDSIERLTNDMWSIRRMLHDFETRRSRRFWRMMGMLLLDTLAYVGLILVWLCTSVYNLFARQKRAITRIFVASPPEQVRDVHPEDEAYVEDDEDYSVLHRRAGSQSQSIGAS